MLLHMTGYFMSQASFRHQYAEIQFNDPGNPAAKR